MHMLSHGGEDMQTSKMLAVLGIAVLSLYLLGAGEPGEWIRERAAAGVEEGRMKNVTVSEAFAASVAYTLNTPGV